MSGSFLASAGVSVIQLGAAVTGGPLLHGLMAKVRARAEGRAGAPVRQPLLDLWKLAAKERIHAEHSSAVLPLAPLRPRRLRGRCRRDRAAASRPGPRSAGPPMLFAVVFLLLLGSVAVALAGLDTGTAFGGMGASRAMTIGALAEPALLVAVLALSLPAGTSNLPRIVTAPSPTLAGRPARSGCSPSSPCSSSSSPRPDGSRSTTPPPTWS